MTDDKAALGGDYVIFAHGKIRKQFPTIDECMNWCLGLTSGLPWSERTIGEIKELLSTHGFYVTQRALSDTRYLIMPSSAAAALLPAQRGEGDDVERVRELRDALRPFAGMAVDAQQSNCTDTDSVSVVVEVGILRCASDALGVRECHHPRCACRAGKCERLY